jgi:Na+/phosphate symporter
LIGLVAFQTLINLLAAIICFPFLNKLSKGLLRMFRDVEQRSTLYLEKNLPAMPTLAIEMFRLEVFYFLKRVLNFTVREFNISPDETGIRKLFTEREWKRESPAEISSTHYEEIKHAQGEMMEYFVALQKLPLQPEELHEINQEIKSVHSAMHAAKGFKDILHNRTELLQSANDIKFEKFALFSAAIKQTHSRFASILATVDRQAAFEELAALLQDIQHTYSNLLDSIYRETAGQQLPDKDVSTLQNMNRELYSANKSLIYALADFLLESQQSEDLKSLPLLVR